MAGKQVQRRRGTTADHSTFVGAFGESTVDTNKWVAVIHDGVTEGGHPQANAADLAAVDAKIPVAIAGVLPLDGSKPMTGPLRLAGPATVDLNPATFKQLNDAVALLLPKTGQAADSALLQGHPAADFRLKSEAGGGATGGGTDQVFYENDVRVTQDYTLTANKNAMSAGPITINDGVVVTIPDNQTWVIV